MSTPRPIAGLAGAEAELLYKIVPEESGRSRSEGAKSDSSLNCVNDNYPENPGFDAQTRRQVGLNGVRGYGCVHSLSTHPQGSQQLHGLRVCMLILWCRCGWRNHCQGGWGRVRCAIT